MIIMLETTDDDAGGDALRSREGGNGLFAKVRIVLLDELVVLSPADEKVGGEGSGLCFQYQEVDCILAGLACLR